MEAESVEGEVDAVTGLIVPTVSVPQVRKRWKAHAVQLVFLSIDFVQSHRIETLQCRRGSLAAAFLLAVLRAAQDTVLLMHVHTVAAHHEPTRQAGCRAASLCQVHCPGAAAQALALPALPRR